MTASAPIAGAPIASLDDDATQAVRGVATLSTPARHEVFLTLGIDAATTEGSLAMKLLVGASIDPKVLFTVDKIATDPETVTFRIRKPDGTETAYVYGVDDEVVRIGAGAYQAHVELDAAARWLFRWEGTGECDAVGEIGCDVLASRFTTFGAT